MRINVNDVSEYIELLDNRPSYLKNSINGDFQDNCVLESCNLISQIIFPNSKAEKSKIKKISKIKEIINGVVYLGINVENGKEIANGVYYYNFGDNYSKVKKLKLSEFYTPKDIIVKENNIFVLASHYNSKNKLFTTRVYQYVAINNLNMEMEILSFDYSNYTDSFEELDGDFYFKINQKGTIRVKKQYVKQVYKVNDSMTLDYFIDGEHIIRNIEDKNKNNVPDYIEVKAKQLKVRFDYLTKNLGMKDPLTQNRYKNIKHRIFASLRKLKGRPSTSHGVVYDGSLNIIFKSTLSKNNSVPPHELFHIFQYGYSMFKNPWYCEGQARSLDRMEMVGYDLSKMELIKDELINDKVILPLPQTLYDLETQVLNYMNDEGKRYPYGSYPLFLRLYKIFSSITFLTRLLENVAKYDKKVVQKRTYSRYMWSVEDTLSEDNTPYLLCSIKDTIISQYLKIDSSVNLSDSLSVEEEVNNFIKIIDEYVIQNGCSCTTNYHIKSKEWKLYGKSQENSSIMDIYDKDINSYVIKLQGNKKRTGYFIGDSKGKKDAWNNRDDKRISWDMKYFEEFIINVKIDTKYGERYLNYKPEIINNGIDKDDKRFINYGLGSDIINGNWVTIRRDLEIDLKRYESDNELLSVNAFYIRGSGFINNIELSKNYIVYEDSKNDNLNRWRIYDNTPSGATIGYVRDNEKQSNVIQTDGDGWKNGYILGNFEGKLNAWGNTDFKMIKWDMKFEGTFEIFVRLVTKYGIRTLCYTAVDKDMGNTYQNSYIHHCLGFDANNGKWHTFKRDLELDLQDLEPINSIVVVNGFYVRGSGFLNNIEMGTYLL